MHAKPPANGLYRSDDAGASWRLVNEQNGTAWYYSQVRCDPTDPDHVITLNAQSRESHDGGKTFAPFAAGGVHSDHHALWINDDNPEQMILGGDGGLYMSWDAGRTWDHIESIVAGQFYAIAVDDALPFYNVYGGLQDNQTWGGPSRTRNSFGPTNADWFRMAGGDGFYAVPDPLDHNLVYAESQQGGVVRYDARTGQTKNIRPTPKPGERFRFNWSAPILPSQARREDRLHGGAVPVQEHRSRRQLGKDQPRPHAQHRPQQAAAARRRARLRHASAATKARRSSATSRRSTNRPFRSGLLVVGTDDGIIQVTRDGGKTWTKTDKFPGVPDTTFVSRVVWSKANEGTIYATLDGHRSNDFKPYVVKSTDYGKTWTSITGNLPDGGSVQVDSRASASTESAVRRHGVRRLLHASTAARSGRSSRAVSRAFPCTTFKFRRAPTISCSARTAAASTSSTTSRRSRTSRKAKQAAVAYLFPVQDALLFQPNNSRNSGMGTRGFSGQNPDPGARIAYTPGRRAGRRQALARRARRGRRPSCARCR